MVLIFLAGVVLILIVYTYVVITIIVSTTCNVSVECCTQRAHAGH